jgi:hypothetical protein
MSRSSFASFAVTGALAAALAAGAVACGPAKDSAAPSGASAGTTTVSAPAAHKSEKPAAKPAVKPAFKGSGMYQVGVDIHPGTYVTSGNAEGTCYWERAKDAKGDMDSVLANDNVTGSSYVTIAKSDKYFKTTDCKDWYAVTASRSGTARTVIPGSGMYKVGSDIRPGTYKSTGNKDDGCYWERSKDALHGTDSIIANDNVSGTVIVTVARSDAYFASNGCGDWHKTG